MTFPSELLGSFWHTTSVSRYLKILKSGSIHPNPDIELRWGTGQGSEFYPFVRVLGGVSIFDFHKFNFEKYSRMFPSSSLYSFVPVQRDWEEAIWIQLLPNKMPGKFLNGAQLKTLQNEKKSFRNKLMPIIECAYIGLIPVDTFVSVLRYDEEHGFTKYS
ncbi:MAG: hypothetical protein COA90_11535 [Gammaproteobacteria bacterium]|nr:MAG: hypothetical protein COA90_11535 [Gammaproteobacteria bacterium]